MWINPQPSPPSPATRSRLLLILLSSLLCTSTQAAEPLPDMRQFVSQPSSQFVIDWRYVRTGHPYKGRRAAQPHTGAHVYFQPPAKRLDPGKPTSYPPIYAVANGYVARIDESFKQREMFNRVLNKRQSNYRYGVTLAIGLKQSQPVHFHYSIEPMVDPGNVRFYQPFILVKKGQRVRQGQVIAHMYLPDHPQLQANSHIHFNLMDTGQREFMAPTIFTDKVNREFHRSWGRRGFDDKQAIPACMGFRLTAPENPFGTGPQDRQ
ncbi:MAG: hypothetical protein VB862_06620 [Pirellulaceae bacterium]